MEYISTRGGMHPLRFSDILLGGLAPDGGLVMPASIPQIDNDTLQGWRGLSYAQLAFEVLSRYCDDIPADDLKRLVEETYTAETFGTRAITPLTELEAASAERGSLLVQHLSNGPTLAFKDMAMQLLGELFEYELERRGDWLTIVGATSGDTGSAAEYALRGRKGLSVVMLTPAGRMTPFQRAQMFSLLDENIVNVAVDGVFDDCQDLVKAVNIDAEFKQQWHVGAVNSINWARLLAQVVYYIATWLRLSERLGEDARVNVCVPSGNFGNICAAHIARQMGLPLGALVVATNENNVLEEFFRTGVYRVRGSEDTLATSSPSMDISKASNFERFIFDLVGRDAARTRELFTQVATQGYFDLSQTEEFAGLRERFGFCAASSTHSDRLAQIRRTWEESHYLLDPHTADGVQVARQVAGQLEGPVVVMETALPVKFEETIAEAVGFVPPVPLRFADIEGHEQKVVALPRDVDALKELIRTRVQPGR